ncbi:MAG: methyltransferase domain-containing protein [Planctomycetota bacterium]
MKQSAISSIVRLLGLIVVLVPMAQVSAGPARKGITGDWEVKVDFDGREFTSILSLSNDKDGKLKGEWISFWGISELRSLEYESSQLSFVQVYRFGENETTSNFKGTISGGMLSGTFSSDRGEYKAEGKRLARVPAAAGSWEMKFKVQDREITTTLQVKADAKGKLTANWQSEYGEHKITDVNFKNRKLTFKRTSKMQDREWESTFEGTVKGAALSGVIKSEFGDITAEGKRIGAAIVGQWVLEVASDSGSRKQLLRVNPDLSAMYGPIAIEKVDIDNDRVTFKTSMAFGDQNFEISFAGKVNGKKLTGELTSSRGTRQVTGEKRLLTPAKQKTAKVKKASRKPDVIYVPTPQEVVDKMLELAQVKKSDLVYDLGCGDGRIVVTAAKKYGCKAVGYDINPKRVKEALHNVDANDVGNLVRIEREDIFTLDLSQANVITLYLLPSLNVKLIPQLEKLKPGSRIVSHDFDMRGVKPDKVVEVTSSDEDWDTHTIYLWTTPLKKEDVSDE